MRTVAIAVIAALAGATAGAWVMHDRLQPRVETLTAEVERTHKRINDLVAAADTSEDELEQLLAELRKLEDQARDLERRLAQTSAPQEPEALDDEVIAGLLESLPLPEPQEADETEEDDAERGRGRRGRGRDEDLTEEEREARRARWEAMRSGMRDRVDDFFQGEFEAAADPAAQERLAQMEEHTNYLMDAREAMRQAESDEEREELRQAFGESAMALRDLVDEQQDYMLRTLAEEHGIKKAEDQDAFVASMQEMQSSIFFRPERVIWGMGGGPGRGSGGPGFGGFGPRRGPPAP